MKTALIALAFTLAVFFAPAAQAIEAEGNVAAEPAAPVTPAAPSLNNDAAVPVTPEGTPAPAADSGFICTPGFSLVDDDGGYKLKGEVQTPTPGYAYDITDVDVTEDGKVTGILRLSAPDGMVTEVISHLAISFDIPREGEFKSLTLGLEKSFNWGISSIACSSASMDDLPPQ